MSLHLISVRLIFSISKTSHVKYSVDARRHSEREKRTLSKSVDVLVQVQIVDVWFDEVTENVSQCLSVLFFSDNPV
jgi:hypothetical protein